VIREAQELPFLRSPRQWHMLPISSGSGTGLSLLFDRWRGEMGYYLASTTKTYSRPFPIARLSCSGRVLLKLSLSPQSGGRQASICDVLPPMQVHPWGLALLRNIFVCAVHLNLRSTPTFSSWGSGAWRRRDRDDFLHRSRCIELSSSETQMCCLMNSLRLCRCCVWKNTPFVTLTRRVQTQVHWQGVLGTLTLWTCCALDSGA
jgi:hypothetical protein